MRERTYQLPGSNGVGVLLVHGLTGAPAEMKFLARRLNKAGFAINAPLLAGHGADQKALLGTTWRDWLESLQSALERLQSENDTVCVAGVCVGGALGLMLTLHNSAIASAVVYSATFEYDGWNMSRWYRKSPKILQHVAHLPGIRTISVKEPYPYGLKDERLREYASKPGSRFIEGALDRLPLGALYQMYKLGQHLEKAAPQVKTPTLILHARDDDMSNPRNAHRLCAALGGPARVELLTDSYHMIHVDKERNRVADLTAEFMLAPDGVRAQRLEAACA